MESDLGKCGQEILITELFKQHSERIIERAHRTVKDKNLCDDILQDCMINTLQNVSFIESMDEKQKINYLQVTVDNLSEKYAFQIQNEFVFIESLSEEFYTDLYNVEIFVENNIELEMLSNTISQLNERDRKIIIMKYLMRMHDREIAPLLNIKESSVRMTVRRSVFHLKQKLGVIKNHETIA